MTARAAAVFPEAILACLSRSHLTQHGRYRLAHSASAAADNCCDAASASRRRHHGERCVWRREYSYSRDLIRSRDMDFNTCRTFRTTSFRSQQQPDPTAKRPNKVCDPYGQGGKPLSLADASGLMTTLEDGWTLEEVTSTNSASNGATECTGSSGMETNVPIPLSVYKEFYHDSFIAGSKFVSQVAAVAHNNNHYPVISLERRLMKREKAWRVVSCVKCLTPTLGGLSYNDFHLAMLVDVEVARPEVADMIVSGPDSLKKHT